MEEDRKKFEKLYEEYKKLKVATHIEAQILKPGQPYKLQSINPDDFMRRKKLAKELVKNYKDHFKGMRGELYDIELDAM